MLFEPDLEVCVLLSLRAECIYLCNTKCKKLRGRRRSYSNTSGEDEDSGLKRNYLLKGVGKIPG